MARKTKAVTQSRRAYLEDAITQHERIAREALQAGSFGPANLAKVQARKARNELDQLTASEAAVEAIDQEHPGDLMRGILADVRRMRVASTEAGSYVAAERLIKTEAEIVAKMAATAAPEMDLAPDELVQVAIDDLRALPPDLRQRIIDGASA